MKHRTATLEGAQLDAAVALAEGKTVLTDFEPGCWVATGFPEGFAPFSPSSNWSEAGPIIDRELIAILTPWRTGAHWEAMVRPVLTHDGYESDHEAEGPTPLIAAMRAFVASKFGEQVELP